MGWQFASNGWELGGLSFTHGDMTLVSWVYHETGKVSRPVTLGKSGSNQKGRLGSVADDGRCFSEWLNSSAGGPGVTNSNSGGGYGWRFCWTRFDSTNTQYRTGYCVPGSAFAGNTDTDTSGATWPGAEITTISVNYDGATYGAIELAHIGVWKQALSDADLESLFNGGAGGGGKAFNTVQSSDLIFYLWDSATLLVTPGAASVSQIGSGTPTWNGSNLPTVDDPPGGGGSNVSLTGSAMTGGHGTQSPVFSIPLKERIRRRFISLPGGLISPRRFRPA